LAGKNAVKVIVVDGGTQVERVSSLESTGLSGGKYIAAKVEEFGSVLPLETSIGEDLHMLNSQIREDEFVNHPEIIHEENSKNVPYGSIAGIKLHLENNTLEIVNAGDVFVVTVDRNGKPELHTVDTVYPNDQRVFAKAQEVAAEVGISVKEAIEKGLHGEDAKILQELHETIRRGNTGEIRRIAGANNFSIHSSFLADVDRYREIDVFSDGVVPPGLDIHTQEGLEAFVRILESGGIAGVENEGLTRSQNDPNFQQYPRFRDRDDFTFVRLLL
jgi:hypothetical protein